jgi:hypothetical protein
MRMRNRVGSAAAFRAVTRFVVLRDVMAELDIKISLCVKSFFAGAPSIEQDETVLYPPVNLFA